MTERSDGLRRMQDLMDFAKQEIGESELINEIIRVTKDYRLILNHNLAGLTEDAQREFLRQIHEMSERKIGELRLRRKTT